VYLYIQNKQILGCLVAEDIDKANRMLDMPEALCSEEFFPALCGISRIWTAQSARRKGVASRLVDSLRFVFLFIKPQNCFIFLHVFPGRTSFLSKLLRQKRLHFRLRLCLEESLLQSTQEILASLCINKLKELTCWLFPDYSI
jgi:ESCO1/2 acetyl-transferase